MVSSSKPDSPLARARELERQYARSPRTPISPSSFVTPSPMSSTNESYKTPASTLSTQGSGRSTPTKIPGPKFLPPANKRKNGRSSTSSSSSNIPNNQLSSDEEGPWSSNRIFGVQKGKMPQMSEHSRFHSRYPRDLPQWMKFAIELEIGLVWRRHLQLLLDKLREETQMLRQAGEQLKSITTEKGQALHEYSELEARKRVLEARLSKSEEELRELREKQDTKRVLSCECQGVKHCSNKDVGKQRGSPKDIREATVENMIWLKDRWNVTATERNKAWDQAESYRRKTITLEQKQVELNRDKAELEKQLKASRSDVSKQKWDLEKAEEKSKRHESENVSLKQQKAELEMENAGLMKQLDAYKSGSIKQQAPQINASTQTDSEAGAIVAIAEGHLVTLTGRTPHTVDHAATQDNGEVSVEVQAHKEESQDQRIEPQEDHLEGGEDKKQDIPTLDAMLRHGRENLERLMATDNGMDSERNIEPDTTEQQDTNKLSAQGDRNLTGSPVQMTLEARQAVAPAEPVPEPPIAVPIQNSERRRGNKVSKVNRHRRKDKESRHQKKVRHHHRSNSNKKRHTPTTKIHRVQKQETGAVPSAWIRCRKHPSLLWTYLNMKVRFGPRCMVRSSGRIW
ncbi:hypothetical protein FLAG1_08421 [Fusarium langsethiae]|uniref:Uncharacterized protein n=1 Tax=Fusarium langsethiae TaxID=179993 RepID=A0A0N0DCU6_FUSLA|nr:hypothetical protein FLAG1_08421 [Fusarium langsethiae]GKU06126.1 unnamed protein product [Fusarium langsethiae]GKU21248.1 unnamed protein product [Fusarium langsethiae]